MYTKGNKTMLIILNHLRWITLLTTLIWSPVYGEYKGIPSTAELANMDAVMSACIYTGLIPEAPAQDIRHIIGMFKSTEEVSNDYFKRQYKAAKQDILDIKRKEFEALCAAASQSVYSVSLDYQKAYCDMTQSELCE